MTKNELAKRIVAKIKDEKKLRYFAVLGLESQFNKEQLWRIYDNKLTLDNSDKHSCDSSNKDSKTDDKQKYG